MITFNDLISGNSKLAVIGLGYVGMPIAVAFARHVDVIGYDNNSQKIKRYLRGEDPTREVGDKAIQETTMTFTDDPSLLQEANFHIVAVPTPINLDKTPNLRPVIGATEVVGENLTKGSIVVYESTVYPGATEEVCIPLLEEKSGLVHGKDFIVGYSPERINPGDKVHTLENITKIVSSSDNDYLDTIAQVYEIVVKAGTHKVANMKIAEAAKVVENSQRDINIAFMNELAMAFDRMGIDSKDVIDAMNTKWNALGFSPGLVGGHCIGVDPYYFIYEAENLGYHSQIIANGREINDSMGEFIAEKLIKQLIRSGKNPSRAEIVLLGFTFKEHTPDTRNSRAIDIVRHLEDYNINVKIVDPWADLEEAKQAYNIKFTPIEEINNVDALVFVVGHDEFKKMSFEEITSLFNPQLANEERIIIDVKSILDKQQFIDENYNFWRL